ncbi:glycosyltransferase [Lutibacter holmesii]|uniref:Glycosyltransferase n=1 Tax=Lutibacter holmesii TaxID=1137985 RepID=A0ABW3WPL2_9FLAO
MNLLYDISAIQPNLDGKYHGGGKYGKIVFFKLVEMSINSNLKLFALFDDSKFLEKDIMDLISINNIIKIDLNKVLIDDIVSIYNIDKFYTALPYNFKNLSKINCKIIGAIHGLRGLEMELNWHSLLYVRGKLRFKNIIKILLKNKVKKRQLIHFKNLFNLQNINLYAVSNHTKYSIKTFVPNINIDKLKVFYSPDVTTTYKKKNNINGNYFLLVSGNRWLKNNLRAAKAIDAIISENSKLNYKVIITGVTNKKVYLKHIVNKESFILKKYVAEEELFNLYAHAYAFIYPTLNEGFGYPPLEAMRFGVPVVTTAFSSIPEICSNAVLYANPYSVSEIKNRILNLIFNNNLYKQLQQNGISRFETVRKKQREDLDELISFILS